MAGRSAILAIKIIADAAGAKKGFQESQSAAAKFEAGIGKASTVATAGLTALAAGAVHAAGKASDLAESTNAVGKVFEDNAGTITSFGENAAQSVGLSQRAFQELATGTGSLLTNFGLSTQDAADSTVMLAERAADMASVFNVDVEQALGAVNAGLRGESEPLRAFGVGLSATAIEAEAVALNLHDGTGALDENAKAQAAMSLIMEQTEKVSGDFADTSDGLANRQKILTATMEDTTAELGEALVPVMEDALGIVQSLVTWIANNTDTVRKLIAAAAALAAAIIATNAAMKTYRATMILVNAATKIYNSTTLRAKAYTIAYRATTIAITAAQKAYAVAQWALNAAMTANPVGALIALIVLLVAAVVLAYKKSDTFRGIVDKLGRAIKTGLVSAFNAAKTAIAAVSNALQTAWRWASNLIAKVVDLINKLKSIGGGILGKLNPFSSSSVAAAGAPVGAMSTAGTRTATTRATSSVPVTINLYGSGDPATSARMLKRALEGEDIRQGRPRGTPLAFAW